MTERTGSTAVRRREIADGPPAGRARRAARRLAAGLLLATLPAAAATAPPEEYRATYRLTSDGTRIGTLVQELAATGTDRYRFRSTVDPAGLLVTLVSGTIEETTELERVDDRLRPLRYRYRRSGLGSNRKVDIVFDWSGPTARNEVGGDAWKMAVTEDTLDKHSLLLAVMQDLRRNETPIEYPVADGGRLKRYRHRDLGTETVTTPLGTFATRHLRRIRVGKQRGTDFWHAPELGYLPVVVERIDGDGRRLRLELTGLASGNGAAEPGSAPR